ncbi:MAG: ACP S-malonyltransferase, partial [Bacillota bacterium]
EIFDRAAEALDLNMAALCFEGPEEELKKTVNAQPAILTVSIACYKVLRQQGIIPDILAGHSLGEYSALVAAGALDFVDALRLVKLRGQYMQEAVPLGEGGMVAVLGLEIEKVVKVCFDISQSGGTVEAVNLNCPGQVVIAGDNKSLVLAAEQLKLQGARKCIPLPVSAPFHSSLMKPAGNRLAHDLALVQIGELNTPVLSNVTADYHGRDEDIRHLLVKQVYSPVRWEECVRRMITDGVTRIVELGPGKVISGLIKKIDSNVRLFNVEDQISLDDMLMKIS